jgi:hypothetical protein
MWSVTTIQKRVQWLTARRIRWCCVGKFQVLLLIRTPTASIIVWFISCIIYHTRLMWYEFRSVLGCVFRSFWFLNQRRYDVQRGLSSQYHGYSNCIMLRCVHYVRHIWHAWYVRIWLSILILNHLTKMFQIWRVFVRASSMIWRE